MLGWRVWSARVRELWLNALCSWQALLPSGRASFGHRSGHRSKTTCLSAFPSISNNLSGQDFHGAAYHGPRDKRKKKTAMGTVGQSSATHAGPAVKARLVNNQ